jgi:hypothetical protein
MQAGARLPEAEFFIFLFHVFKDPRAVEPGSYDSTFYNVQPRDLAEARRIFRGRLTRRMDLDPRFRPAGTPVDHFDDPNLPMTADLFPASTAFDKPTPESLPHYGLPDERMHLWPPRAIVSPDWRAAVEALEPGVHEFFAHELRFNDTTVNGHFLFRGRQAVAFLDYDACSDMRIETRWDGAPIYRLAPDRAWPRRVVGRREPLQGRHWVDAAGQSFVSRALAERLAPLLPRGAEFAPIALTGPEREGT